MTTLKQMVDETLLKLNGYGLVQPRAAFLSAATTTADVSWTVGSSVNFAQGIAEVEGELVFVESTADDSNTISLSPDGRGYYGTAPAVHPIGARLTMSPVWPRIEIERTLNDAIANTYPVLFGVATHTFTFNAAVNTYEIPAAAESILRVTADTVGPSNEQQNIRRYAFNSVASSEFVSGNTLTLMESVFPGKTVTVTYVKAPSEITSAQDLTVSGLRETAKTCLIYYACSHLLAYMDPSRLQVNAAEADEFDERNAVGTAAKIANNLYARYELELERERKRLRATTPVPVTIRNR